MTSLSKTSLRRTSSNDESEDETSLKYNTQTFNERKLNVKDFNVERRLERNDHRELLLVVGVQFRKEGRYLTRNIEYDHTTQYVNNLEDFVNLKFLKPHSRDPRLLTDRRPELVSSTIET